MGFVEDNFFSEVFSYLIYFKTWSPRILINKYCFRLNNGPRMPPLIRRPRGLTNAQIGVGVSRYILGNPVFGAQKKPNPLLLVFFENII